MTSEQFKAHGEAVLEDLVGGLTEEEAAQKRDISPRTIRYWLQRGANHRMAHTARSPRPSPGPAASVASLPETSDPSIETSSSSSSRDRLPRETSRRSASCGRSSTPRTPLSSTMNSRG